MSSIKITKSNFFWTLGNKVVWNIRDYISSNYDEWIAHSISWFPIVYIETHHKEILKEYHKQPFNYMRRIIQTQDYEKMQNVFSKTKGKTIYYQIRFYQEFLEAFFPYLPSILKRTGGNEKDKFEFMGRVFARFVSPKVYTDQQKQMPHNINITTANNTTKDDIGRIVKHYEEFLNTTKAKVNSFAKIQYAESIEDFLDYIAKDYDNPTADKKRDEKAERCLLFETSMYDFKDIAGDIDNFFNEMVTYIKTGIPKRASTFKLSNEFKITYLGECNRLVQEFEIS